MKIPLLSYIESATGKVSVEPAALGTRVGTHHDHTESCFIAMVNYSDLIYEDIQLPKDVTGMTRRTFMLEVTQLLNDGQVWVLLMLRVAFHIRRALSFYFPF